MKPEFYNRRRGRRKLRLAEYLLFTTAFALLGYVAYSLSNAKIWQWYESRRFERAREMRPLPTPPSRTAPRRPSPAPGQTIGRIEVPRLELSAMVREGEDARTLSTAVGHIPGTPLPGEEGNVVLAGHRDTFFRGLRHIRKDDIIYVRTYDGDHQYVVESTKVVKPTYVEAMAPTPEPALTLVTCYPFSYIGRAPKRYIVRARAVDETAPDSSAREQPPATESSTDPDAELIFEQSAEPQKRNVRHRRPPGALSAAPRRVRPAPASPPVAALGTAPAQAQHANEQGLRDRVGSAMGWLGMKALSAVKSAPAATRSVTLGLALAWRHGRPARDGAGGPAPSLGATGSNSSAPLRPSAKPGPLSRSAQP